MSGTFPSSPAPKTIRIGSVQPTRESVSHSLKRQARTTDVQRWALALQYPPMERASLAPIFASLVSQRGRFDTFQYVLPTPLNSPRGVGAVGSPLPYVDGSQVSPTNDAQTGRSITTRGWTPSAAVLMAGDFLKFASHSKIYMVREDATSNGAGQATVLLEPAIQLSGGLADGDQITTHSVPFTVAITNDTSEFSIGIGHIFELEVELMEVY